MFSAIALRKGSTMKSPMHEKDFLLWTEQQAAVLRAGNLAELDLEGILEEIEDMGNAEKHALRSLISNILSHLLKMEFSTAAEPMTGWREEISEFRAQAEARMEDTPSLTHYVESLFQKAWPQARKVAEQSFKNHGEKVVLPKDCPYSLDQVLDYDFYPNR